MGFRDCIGDDGYFESSTDDDAMVDALEEAYEIILHLAGGRHAIVVAAMATLNYELPAPGQVMRSKNKRPKSETDD